jgi:hypothetical protein
MIGELTALGPLDSDAIAAINELQPCAVAHRRRHAAIRSDTRTDDMRTDDRKYLPRAGARRRYGVSDMWIHRRLHDDPRFPRPMKSPAEIFS